eukprot:symbB.v1.2.021803.t1/scaffold1905.1/size96453/7
MASRSRAEGGSRTTLPKLQKSASVPVSRTRKIDNTQSLPRLLGAGAPQRHEESKDPVEAPAIPAVHSVSRAMRRELLEVLSNPDIRKIATKYYEAQLPKSKSRLGFRDLRQVLKALNQHLGLPVPTAVAAEQLFKRFDFNGDGDLSFEEFFELFVTSLRRVAFDRSVLLGREVFVTREPGKAMGKFFLGGGKSLPGDSKRPFQGLSEVTSNWLSFCFFWLNSDSG